MTNNAVSMLANLPTFLKAIKYGPCLRCGAHADYLMEGASGGHILMALPCLCGHICQRCAKKGCPEHKDGKE